MTGLYILAASDIFKMMEREENRHLAAWVSFYEIYQGRLFDLLNNRKVLHPREDGRQNVVIASLHEIHVENVRDVMAIYSQGNKLQKRWSNWRE